MTVMVTKGRQEEIISVLSYFIELVKEEKKIGTVEVTSSVELDSEQKKQVENKLLATTKYQSLEMNFKVDETLIGGMIIRIGDRVVDGSVKTKLYNLSRELRNVQL